MRKIKLDKWTAKVPKFGEDGKTVVATVDKEEDLLMAIDVLIAQKRPEELPRGIEKFQIFGKVATAFDKAKESRELVLEEREYKFLKDLVEKDVPAMWAMNKHLSKAINDFLNAPESVQTVHYDEQKQ